MIRDYNELLELIQTMASSTKIFVSTILPRPNSRCDNNLVNVFNGMLSSHVNWHKASFINHTAMFSDRNGEPHYNLFWDDVPPNHECFCPLSENISYHLHSVMNTTLESQNFCYVRATPWIR